MDESKEIRWRKVGGGSLRYIRGKIIKPNEVFLARVNEIPSAFRKQIVALDEIPEALALVAVKPFVAQRKESAPIKVEADSYAAQKRAFGWWDVVNTVSGKVINEKGLREDMAIELVKELNA